RKRHHASLFAARDSVMRRMPNRAILVRSAHSYFGVEEGSYHGDRGRWILFHDPVTGVRDHAFAHIAGGKAHDLRHGLSKRPLAANRQHRHGKLAFRKERLVVFGILIESSELHEARMHGAWHRVE